MFYDMPKKKKQLNLESSINCLKFLKSSKYSRKF